MGCALTGQPQQLHADRVVEVGQHVRGVRHLDEGGAAGGGGELLEDHRDRGQRGLVAHDQQPSTRGGVPLDAAVRVAAARCHRRDPVADPGRQRPGAARPRRALVDDDVDDEPGVVTAADDVAHGVGAQVAALRFRPVQPLGVPALVGALEARHDARRPGEDELDPLVEPRPFDAEVGQQRAAELDADEARREPGDRADLDGPEQQRQLGGGAGHDAPRCGGCRSKDSLTSCGAERQIEVRWKDWKERDGVGPRWPW